MNIKEYILDCFITPKCSICGDALDIHRVDKFVCSKCRGKMPFIDGNVCEKCGKPMEEDYIFCERCKKSDFIFEKGFAAFKYGVMKEPIAHFKFKGYKHDGIGLANLMYEFLQCNYKDEIKNIDILIPIPIHWVKKISRGFNQSDVLSDELGKLLGKESVKNAVIRTKHTKPQNALSSKERYKNINDAFKVVNKKLIKGKSIMIIDDIFTTGSTINECAKKLYDNGAKNVCFYTLSITVGE